MTVDSIGERILIIFVIFLKMLCCFCYYWPRTSSKSRTQREFVNHDRDSPSSPFGEVFVAVDENGRVIGHMLRQGDTNTLILENSMQQAQPQQQGQPPQHQLQQCSVPLLQQLQQDQTNAPAPFNHDEELPSYDESTRMKMNAMRSSTGLL
uniref:Uncharacterized protein n=1 Tax=Plectus sambesii TaxID=2011161 RepID=A0A914XCL5_9BILA